MLGTLNFEGLGIGLATFLIIGIFHPLVIKGEYYMGQKCNLLFAIGGVAMMVWSVLSSGVVSLLTGVTAFSCFWSILEVKEQRERVRKGWFPANPRRKERRKEEKCYLQGSRRFPGSGRFSRSRNSASVCAGDGFRPISSVRNDGKKRNR